MHTNMYAGYACGCSLSVKCQVAMVNYNLRAIGSHKGFPQKLIGSPIFFIKFNIYF